MTGMGCMSTIRRGVSVPCSHTALGEAIDIANGESHRRSRIGTSRHRRIVAVIHPV